MLSGTLIHNSFLTIDALLCIFLMQSMNSGYQMGYIGERNSCSVLPKIYFIRDGFFCLLFSDECLWILCFSSSNCEVTGDNLSTGLNQN